MFNNLRYDKKQKFMCFDMESYNLNLVGHGNVPWQISWRIFDSSHTYEEKDYYVNWGRAPKKEIQELTNYSQARMDREGLDPAEMFGIIEEKIYDEDYIIVGHNLLGFDIYLYNLYRKAMGYRPDYSYVDRIIDTLCLAKSMRFDKEIDRANFRTWQFKMTELFARNMKCKLSDLAKEFGIPFDEKRLHDSSYDIWLNEQVFKKLMWSCNL